MAKDVKVFALTTCIHCKKAKQFLDDNEIAYAATHVDTLAGDERQQTIDEVKKFNPALSFPTIVVDGDVVVVGFNQEELKKALEL